jgi:3-oxoacyl-[acyl-carrier protein] reductase
VSTEQLSAIVTGGSRGIGLGVAGYLAGRGWSLTLVARNPDQLDAAAAELGRRGANVTTVAADMAEDSMADGVVEHHERTYGSLDALILAAGVGSGGPIANYPLKRFDKQFAVNVRAPFALVARALPLLRTAAASDPRRCARVVALTSIEGVYPEAGLAAYASSKAALLSLVRSVNIEESANRVIATALSPAFVDTAMSDWTKQSIPADTMIPVDDVVRVVAAVLDLSANAVVEHIVINRRDAGPYQA